MIAALHALTLDLGPTLTYSHRHCVWLPGDPHGDGRVGTLTIVLRHGRAGSKVESDTYAVEEETPAIGVMGRSFLLLNLTDDTQADVYRTTVGHPVDTCSCTAGQCRVPSGCKHRDAVRAVIAEGGFDGPDIRDDRPRPGVDAPGGADHQRHGAEARPGAVAEVEAAAGADRDVPDRQIQPGLTEADTRAGRRPGDPF